MAVVNHYHLLWCYEYYQQRAPFWKYFTYKYFTLDFGFIMIAKRKGYNKVFKRLAWIPLCFYGAILKAKAYFTVYNWLTSEFTSHIWCTISAGALISYDVTKVHQNVFWSHKIFDIWDNFFYWYSYVKLENLL